MDQSRALLMRRYRFSEASLIAVWMTECYGKVKTVARNAAKPGSPFAGRLELFSEVEMGFSLNKKSDLHTLKEVVLLPEKKTIMTHYQTLLTASYFAELCDLFTESMHPAPEVFGLLQRALTFLSKKAPDLRAINHFEKELAKALGVYNPTTPADESLKSLVPYLPKTRHLLLEQFVRR